MRTRSALSLSLAATLAASSLAFGVASVSPAATGISGTATRSGATVSFQGLADLADPGVSKLPGFLITKFADEAAAKAAGIDLVGAQIEEQEDGSGLRFTWKVSSMPAEGVPEGVRYNWAFQAGDQTYQLQVKRSNVASATTAESPVDHVMEAAEGDWWFQLRGACTTNYLVPQSPVSGCYHLGFFDGEVDTATGTVSMELDYGQKDSVGRSIAETFRRGQPIVEAQSATMSITASAQAGVSNTLSSQYLNGWGTYYPGTVVSAALGDSTGATGAFTTLSTPGDGTFAGSLAGAGTHVWVKACTGYGLAGFGADPCTTKAIAIG